MSETRTTDATMSDLDKAKSKKARQAIIVARAKKQFKRIYEYESVARQNFINDTRFANADAYNQYQWQLNVRQSRGDRPCLTINKTMQHVLHIQNDAKQHKPGIVYRPVGNGATVEAAKMFNGLAKYVEYRSQATTAYMHAVKGQTEGGIGYFRIITEWPDPMSFNQDIRIQRIVDPTCVLLDARAKEADKSDAKFGFIFDLLPLDDFKDTYPEYADDIGPNSGPPAGMMISANGTPVPADSVVWICEYFYVQDTDDTLWGFMDGQGKDQTMLESSLPSELVRSLKELSKEDRTIRSRPVKIPQVNWCLIIGDDVKDEKPWAGKYIPIIPVIGTETIIDNTLDRKGQTRALIDPQRMYNYYASGAVEYGAMQTKTPWISDARAIEGFEDFYRVANVQNLSYLPYNGIDDEGNPVAPPTRPPPPEQASLYLTGMQITQQEMMMVSGQYQAEMGAPSNERSGKAITERQRQGDTATYHFIDNLGIAICFAGRILLDLFPKIYDTRRVMQIMAEDGTNMELEIDPEAKQAFQQILDHDQNVIRRILNPSIGTYEVQADQGPSYGTLREQTFEALATIITQAPQLTALIGDLLLRSADFDLADEAAERLKRMIPPQALGKGTSQAEQELMQQNKQLNDLLQQTFNEFTKAQIELKNKDVEARTKAYDSVTKRIAAMVKLLPGGDESGVESTIVDMLRDALAINPSGEAQPEPDGDEDVPIPGARKAPDGQWYVDNPQVPGQFLRVEPK